MHGEGKGVCKEQGKGGSDRQGWSKKKASGPFNPRQSRVQGQGT